MPAGRPKEGLDTLPKGWQGEILDLYKNGGSDVEVRALIYGWRDSFSEDLWYRWIEEEVEFSQTIKRGKKLSEAWWHSMGRVNLMVDNEAPKLNATLWYMNMKNRFGWADKQEITGKNGEAIKTDNKFTVEFVDADRTDK